MELSEAAQFFIGYCYNGSEVRHFSPLFRHDYHREAGEKKFKLTEEILEEMNGSGMIAIKHQDSKMCNLAGVAGMSPHNETNLLMEVDEGTSKR